MNDDEPDAIHYFRKAAEDMEHDVRITLYFLARGFCGWRRVWLCGLPRRLAGLPWVYTPTCH